MKKTQPKKKVFVGLSGGVDSSVSALLLQKAGYDVTGVFIKAWHPDFLPCNWRSEMRDAMRICARLNIPFLMCDLEKEYKKEVIDNLISEYSKGRTPNPDVLCNKQIKFGGFLNWALEKGADYVATGHYAQRTEIDGEFRMLNSADTEKDQTYFLWTVDQEKIKHILFPIGHLEKKDVRKIADKNNLHTAGKKDSQGLCFLGQVDMKSFLRRYIHTEKGDVLNPNGKVIGTHDGSELYTIGERHGFTINEKTDERKIHYVISKNLEQNTITVSDEIETEKSAIKINLENVSFVRNSVAEKAKTGIQIDIKIRYRGELHKCELRFENDWIIQLAEPLNGVALGQSVVFYSDDECLGGGVINGVVI